jgi:hypothetical protein
MRHLLAILLSLLCFPVLADDAAERARLAQRLADLLAIRAQYNQAGAACRRPDADLEKELLGVYAAGPADCGGISPQSAYWPEVRAIYRQFTDTACATICGEQLEPVLIQSFAANMSLADLRAAVAFSASPAGRTLQAATKKVFREATDHLYHGAAADQQAAAATLRRSILILKNKYQAHPQ